MNVTTQGNTESGFQTYINILSGETVALDMTLSSESNPIDLTGYTLKAQINFDAPVVLNNSNGGITVVNASEGKIRLNVATTQTAAIEQGSFDYDVWMANGAIETPLLTGKFVISPNIAAVS